MRFKYLIPVLLLAAVLLAAGCGEQSATTTTSAAQATTASIPAVSTTAVTTAAATSSATTSAAASTTAATAASASIEFPYTFTDDAGRSVTLPALPQRLVSLSPSNTEIVFALGLGEQLVGDTEYCNYPETALAITNVGGFSDVDIEKVLAAQPDLILAADLHEETVLPSLEKLGIPVMVLHAIDLDGIYHDIESLGAVTGRSQAAADLVSDLKTRVEAVTSRTAQMTGEKPRVMYVTWHDPIYSAGDNTITGELIKLAGGTNIAGELDGYATMTLEMVVERNPQIIVVMSSMGSQTSIEYINAESRLQSTDALINHRVELVDSDLFGRTTPRIVDALEQLAQIIQSGAAEQEQ